MVSDEIGIMEKRGVPADAKLPTDQGAVSYTHLTLPTNREV